MSKGSSAILIVNDDRDLVARLTEELVALGYKNVSAVTDGEQALHRVCEQRPDVILAGISLPDMDGFRFCRILQMPLCEDSNRIPVILVAAQANNSAVLHFARSMHTFAVLQYPCEPEALEKMISGALRPYTRDVEQDSFHGLENALIISEERGDILTQSLSKPGWRAMSVSGADKAKELLNRDEYHVILLDDAVVGAHSLLRWIKRVRRDAVVIVMTEATDSESLIRLSAQGADDILRKPLDLGSLSGFCWNVLNRENLLRIQRQSLEQIEQLRAVNDYLDMVIRYSQEAIFSCDLVGRVRIWNHGAEKMYGYAAEEIVGGMVDEFLDPPDFTRKAPDVVRILRQREGSFVEAEVLRRKKSGEVFPVHATYSAIINSHDEYIGFSVIERDVATHMALEAEKIKSARLRAITQTAVTANDQINTPLGVILGYAQFLQRKMNNLAQEDAAALEIIQQQVLKIKGIMNKLKLMSDPIVKNYSIEGVTMLDLSQSK